MRVWLFCGLRKQGPAPTHGVGKIGPYVAYRLTNLREAHERKVWKGDLKNPCSTWGDLRNKKILWLGCFYNCFIFKSSLFFSCETFIVEVRLLQTAFFASFKHFASVCPPACDCYNQGTVTPPDHNPEYPLPCDDKGKCTCLENVIGDKCDSCRDTYWNVGSGVGCEQCLCNPMGSLNNSCDVITGQCPCKPGVTGRTCDQCQSDHYGYSDQGCERK